MIIWNPWSGCMQCCYDCNGCAIIKNKNGKFKLNVDEFNLPMHLFDDKNVYEPMRLKYKSGTLFSLCTLSDFFINDADEFRQRIWRIIKARYDCIFLIETKRVKAIEHRLPYDWGDGWDNVIFLISASCQESLEKQYEFAKRLPLKHIFLSLKPLREQIDLTKLDIKSNVEMVISGGDYFDEINVFDWHKSLANDARELKLGYVFDYTGKRLMIGDTIYTIPENKRLEQAFKAGINQSKIVNRDDYVDTPLILDGIKWEISDNRFIPMRKDENTGNYDPDFEMFFDSNKILGFGNF